MIGKALAEGTDPEVLAEQMKTAFNKALTQKKAAAAEAKAKEAKDNFERNRAISAIDKSFWEHVKNEHLNLTDAVSLTFLILVNDTDFGKSLKTTSELSSLYKQIEDMTKSIEDTFKLKQSFERIFGDNIDKVFDFSGALKMPNKSKDSKDGDTGGTDRKCQINISDGDRIARFLRSL